MIYRTTTYNNRNEIAFEQLAELLTTSSSGFLNVLDVGPGLSLRCLGRHKSRKVVGNLIHRLEIGLRAVLPLPAFAYESYEPNELLAKLNACGHKDVRISLLDINPMVLRVADRGLAQSSGFSIQMDLSKFQMQANISGYFDAVVANAVIKRIGNKSARLNAARNIMSLCKPGAVICSAAPEFRELGCNIKHSIPGFCFVPADHYLLKACLVQG